MKEENFLEEIFMRMKSEGWTEDTEQCKICRRAVQFSNFTYKRSEELELGTTVDCSTLTSQSHWEGALIGIPFVAENQRKASSGKSIDSLDEMIPADVLVKYASLERSPEKTWNHVGLYLGRDKQGTQWLIESTGKTGVRLSRVDAFDPRGGIKRFTMTTQPLESSVVRYVLELAPLVPKFGRLGVRQYRKSNENRLVHRGLDLYVPEGTPVYATVSGIAARSYGHVEKANGIEITSKDMIVRYLMLEDMTIKHGAIVNVGHLLGYVALPSRESDIAYSSMQEQDAHLHLEVELVTKDNVPTEIEVDGKRYANHLYLSKIGILALPFHS